MSGFYKNGALEFGLRITPKTPVATVKFLMGPNKTGGYKYRASLTPAIKVNDVVVVNTWPGTADSTFVTARVERIDYMRPEEAEQFRPQIVSIVDTGPLEQHRKDLSALDAALADLNPQVHNQRQASINLQLEAEQLQKLVKRLKDKMRSVEERSEKLAETATLRQSYVNQIGQALELVEKIRVADAPCTEWSRLQTIQEDLLRLLSELDGVEVRFADTLMKHLSFFEEQAPGLFK